jgi:hypothetical protein
MFPTTPRSVSCKAQRIRGGNIRKIRILYIAKMGYDAEKLAVNFGWTFLRL